MEGENNMQGAAPQAPEPTQGGTPQPEQKSGGDNTLLMGILAYLGILVLIPLFAAKENAFVQFHVKQGLVLLIIEAIVYVAGMMMWTLYPILSIINLAMLVFSILGIINVVQKKQAELPILGQFAKHINF